jgi:hypothetical protein
MSENPKHKTGTLKKRTETASVIANMSGFSKRHVQLVIEGKRNNEEILEASILYEQGKSELIQQIKELVPFQERKLAKN